MSHFRIGWMRAKQGKKPRRENDVGKRKKQETMVTTNTETSVDNSSTVKNVFDKVLNSKAFIWLEKHNLEVQIASTFYAIGRADALRKANHPKAKRAKVSAVLGVISLALTISAEVLEKSAEKIQKQNEESS